MRIAVIGGGPWARDTQIPALAAHPAVTLTGVWTRRPDAAEGLPVRRYSDINALLDDVDAVSCAVPPQAQAQVATLAARAGKHLILDKPVAATVHDAELLDATIREANVRSIVTFTRRYAPETRVFLTEAHGGSYSLGVCRWLSGALLGGKYSSSQWRIDHGALLDVGPHVIDLLDAALGQIIDVVDARRVAANDLWNVTVAHAGGAISTLQMSLRVPARPTIAEFSVAGADGAVSLSGISTDAVACFTTLVDEFISAIESGSEHALNATHGVRIQRVIEAIQDRVIAS